MSKQVVRYKCDCCETLFKTERGVLNHEEKLCWHKPEHMTCFTCGLFVDNEEADDRAHKYFSGLPHCEDGHDTWWEDRQGNSHYRDPETENSIRKFECPFYEPREEHPGEYKKFKTGKGGFRKIYLIDKTSSEES